MKKYIALIITVLSAAAQCFYVAKLPDGQYPVHYNIFLEPDRYGSKWEYLIFAFLPVLMWIIFMIYRYSTRKNENNKKNIRVENILLPVIIAFFIIISWITILSLNNADFINNYMSSILAFCFAVLFLVSSNYMGKVRQNRNLGIKIKATLHNKTVWAKTHRLCGKLGTIGGLLLLVIFVVSLFVKGLFMNVIFLAGLLIAVCLFGIVPTVYAAKLYKKLGDDDSVEENLEEITEEA